jgi:multiple sugar transport system substrate-binding protein
MEERDMTQTNRPNRVNRRALMGGTASAIAGTALLGARSSTFAAPMLAIRQEPVMLQFWGGEPEENGPGDFVAAFNEAQPEFQATYTRYVNDDTGNTQLDTALQGGTQIDVYQSYGIPRTSQRIGAGAALDLTAYIDADPDIKAWTESEELYQQDDTFFSLPTVVDPFVTIANKRLLDEAGVTLPESWTTDEFREMCRQLSSDTVFGTYAPPDITLQILGANRWYKEGGTESNFDDPAFRQNLELHKGMIDEGSSFPWTDVLARDLRVYQQGIFLTEQAPLWVTSSFVLRYVNDLEEFPHDFITTFGPVPVPADATDPWTLGTLGNEVLINPTTLNPDAAWALLRFRLVDGADHYLKSGKQAAFPGQSVDDIVAGILGPDRETLYDVEAYRTAITQPDMRIPTDSITTASAQIQQITQALSDQFLIGEIDIEEALTEMKAQADEAIAQASS